MVNKDTDFFEIVDNFGKTKNIKSTCIIESSLDFVPKITIAIPTFKRADLLKEAIDSALNQLDYSDYDVIVVDNNPERDCETEKLLKSYKNPRLGYYKNTENLQMSGNWNRAFQVARGEYLVLLHDDDLILPSFLYDCARILVENKNIGILKPMSYSLNSDNIDIEKLNNNSLGSSDKIQRLYDFSNFFNFKLGAPTGIVFKKQDVINLGGFNQDFFPVMDFCFAVIFSQKKEVYLYHKYLSIYRVCDNESLKLSCLIPSFEYSFYITKNILEKYKIPSLITNWFLSCKLFLSFNSYKSFNAEFNYNIEMLGLEEPNKFKIIAFKILYRIGNLILNFLTTKSV
jgi:glycosyltransferase involved in cell wall biosynthesis